MWPARHRFFVDLPLPVGEAREINELARQLSAVLRLSSGEFIALCNGDGRDYLAAIQTLTPNRVVVKIVDSREVSADPHLDLTLYQCTLKQDKFEWLLQKGAELGVSHFVPMVSARSVVRPAAALHSKQSRWKTILREATEQCGRTRPPHLTEALEWPPPPLAPGEHAFVAWENATAAPPLGAAVAALPINASPLSLALLIGPEGGLTREEVEYLVKNGWQVVGLGPRILRAETAAVAAVTIVMERHGEMERQKTP